MPAFDALCLHFPKDQLAIHRRLRADEGFRAICVDYCDAYNALLHWEAAGTEGSGRVAQYRALLDELTVELSAHLRRSADTSDGPSLFRRK